MSKRIYIVRYRKKQTFKNNQIFSAAEKVLCRFFVLRQKLGRVPNGKGNFFYFLYIYIRSSNYKPLPGLSDRTCPERREGKRSSNRDRQKKDKGFHQQAEKRSQSNKAERYVISNYPSQRRKKAAKQKGAKEKGTK